MRTYSSRDRTVSRTHLGVFTHTCFVLLNSNWLTQFLNTTYSLDPKLSYLDHYQAIYLTHTIHLFNFTGTEDQILKTAVIS